MPKISEVCEVTSGGRKYAIWETIEVSHSAGDLFIDHALLSVAENSTGAKSLTDLKLKPGDPCEVRLAGQLVLRGLVYLRQAAADAVNHSVQISISSYSYNVMPSTVDLKPGQYLNQTVQRIVSACFAKVGVNFTVIGNPPGAGIPFKSVCECIGETRFAFAERLCKQRNLHMIDVGNSTIAAFRGPFAGSQVLKEGGNILRSRLLLKNNDMVSPIEMVSHDNGRNDSGDANRGATVTVGEPTQRYGYLQRNLKFLAEEPHTQQTAVHRVNQEIDFVNFQTTDGDIVVQGWLCPDNSLWWTHVLEIVTLDSPMMVPQGASNDFMIKGVTHRQSSQGGTETSVYLCDRNGQGSRTGSPLQKNDGINFPPDDI